MKILLTHRYFWPDRPPYGHMLLAIAKGLVQAGHDVTVFASQPSSAPGLPSALRQQVIDGVKVRRCYVLTERKAMPILRLFNVALYCLALFFTILRVRPDIVSVSTFPPVAAGWIGSLAARIVGARFIYHVQDIHPDVSALSGGKLGRGVLARALRWLDNATLRRATVVVTLSPDMANTLTARGVRIQHLAIINNFSLDLDLAPTAVSSARMPDQSGTARFNVIFAGNLGAYQDLPLLTLGIARLFHQEPGLRLTFLGSGTAEAALKAAWDQHPQVRFLPFLPFEQARDIIAQADLGLVSLAPGLTRVAYPSKLLTYLGLGVPVLALVDEDSSLAQDIIANRIGVVAEHRTPEAIAAALTVAMADPSLRKNAAATALSFTAPVVVLRWVDLIGDLAV